MTTIIVSDLHLGPGRDARTGQWSPLEDFFADHAFAAFLDHYVRAIPRDRPTPPASRSPLPAPRPTPPAPHTLILAGDTFNLAEVPGLTGTNLDRPDLEAAHHLHTIAAGHPVLFDALRAWLAAGNNIFVIPGNHDFELAFSHPQSALRNLLTSDIGLQTSDLLDFGPFYHDTRLRLYVEHGDRYCLPRKPGRPPSGYRRDRYLTPALKRRLPEVSNVYRAHYLTQLLTTDPPAILAVFPYLRAYLTAHVPDLPRGQGEHVTLHTINVALINANWDRTRSQLRRATALGAASLILRLVAGALPGAALSVLFLDRNVLVTLTLFLTAGLSRVLSAAATRRAEDIFFTDLPRTAAQDIAPSVARAGVQTLVFGHSHFADAARFSGVKYLNSGTWIRTIDPLSLVPAPTQTFIHVDDAGFARLLHWTDQGPQEPIIVRKD